MTTRNSFTNRISLKGALFAAALGITGLTALTAVSATPAQAAPGWNGHGGHGGQGGHGGHGHGPNWNRPGHGHGHGHHHHRPRPPRHWGHAGVLPFSLGIVSYTVQPECYVVRKKVHVPGVGRVLRPVTVCN